MGFGEILPTANIGAPAALKRALRLGALAALALGFAPGRAAAQATPITACQANPIMNSVQLTADISATSGQTNPCITVGTGGLTVDLNGHTLDVSHTGAPTVAIETGTTNNTTITGNNGKIVTGYASGTAASAIDSQGGTNLTVTGVTLENNPTGTLCTSDVRTNENWGTGINLNGVTGGTISGNSASCYQVGISVQNSAIPRGGSGSISGNTLEGNTYDMNPLDNAGAIPGTYSAGLVLSASSGWTVSNNTIDYNGSEDQNQTCADTGTFLTCSFGLQIIDGSSGNTITSNFVNSNFVGGIMTGSDTSKNSITSNIVQNNIPYDLYEVGKGHGNSFRNNTCSQVGGNLTLRACQ